jgi:hypothetical protein
MGERLQIADECLADVELFRKPKKGCTKVRNVLRESDDVSTALVLPTFADPHHGHMRKQGEARLHSISSI